MANFADCILVKLVPSESDFIALTTFDIYHGKSSRFLLRKKDMEALLNDQTSILDTDIGSCIQITMDRTKRISAIETLLKANLELENALTD